MMKCENTTFLLLFLLCICNLAKKAPHSNNCDGINVDIPIAAVKWFLNIFQRGSMKMNGTVDSFASLSMCLTM